MSSLWAKLSTGKVVSAGAAFATPVIIAATLGTDPFYSAAKKSSSETCACLRMWASVERLIGRWAGTVILMVVSDDSRSSRI